MPKTVATERLLLSTLTVLVAAGCSQAPAEPEQLRLSEQYFAENNTAAAQGSPAQQEFFRRTQHPDFAGQACDLGDTTVELEPAYSTLRPDPGFAPSGIRPRGESWVVGVEVTTRSAGSTTGHQIGSQHLVLLGGRIYGFAPCLNG